MRTPKFTYLPKKKISVTGSRVLVADMRKPARSKACTRRDGTQTHRVRTQDEKIIQVVNKVVPI